MKQILDFHAQLASSQQTEGEPIVLPPDLLSEVGGGMMMHTPFCQFLQYDAFRQVVA